jgi:hypothetical protein
MREKRVDIYLAEAAIYHVVLIGFGTAFLREIFQEAPRWHIVIFSGVLSIIFFIVVRERIIKAKIITRKSKKRSNYE